MNDSTTVSSSAINAQLGFDPDALRAKYLAERDKRIRTDGNDQYVEAKGDFSRYVDDPYVKPISRDALNDEVGVLVIGGGFGGLLAAARLREAGIADIRIIEKGGDFGGTWYWNRYPGAQCDVESYIYLPLLEETGFIPKEKYSFAPEIFEHAQRIGKKFDLYRKALFQTQIKEIRWNEEECRWIVRTDRNDDFRARFVVMSNGPLNRPKLPGIPGIDSYKGHTFHTSRWDYEYTGGDTTGNLDNLGDKRVAIIGTGATAVQCVPYLAKYAKQLYVFQRTPSSVDERRNRPTDPEWARTLTAGWQRRMDNFNILVSGGQQDEDLVGDGWTDIFRNIGGLLPTKGGEDIPPEERARMMELSDFKKMNEIRARVDRIVQDKKTAEALKPWYRYFCKRPTFNDEYLPAFNNPKVTLVDTSAHGGVDRITEKGLVYDGVEYEVDCIIFATGFEVGTAYTRRAGFEIYGRDGKTLTDYWSGGLKTLHGFYSSGFPNCFHMGLSQNAITANFPHMLEEQAQHISAVIKQTRQMEARCLEPTPEAEAEWVRIIREKSATSQQYQQECTPGYYNNEGRPQPGAGFLGEIYGGGPLEFHELIRKWRSDGQMQGLIVE
jgi:cyclohexanone monooxygenase